MVPRLARAFLIPTVSNPIVLTALQDFFYHKCVSTALAAVLRFFLGY
jgi:hypothetical protein